MLSKIQNPLRCRKAVQPGALALAFTILAALSVSAASFSKLWEIPADGTRDYVSASVSERGVAFNPATDHAFIASRASGTRMAVLNATTGAEAGFLNVDGILGGSFALACLGVDDGGRIYGANVSGLPTTTATLRIYRWDTELSVPRLLFVESPIPGLNGRWGESFAIRGAGTNTQILMGMSTGTSLVLFRYTDATQRTLTPLVIDAPGAVSGDLSRGMAFGNGDEFLAHGPSASQLKRFSFKATGPAAGTSALLSAVDVGDGLGGVSFDAGSRQLAVLDVVQHSVRLYDATSFESVSLLGETGFPDPSTPNANGLGQITLKGNRVVALDTQNGVLAAQLSTANAGLAPDIKQNPSSVIYYVGAPVIFSVTAVGDAPLSYQWTFNGENIDQATDRVLFLETAEESAAGIYRVIVSNASGSKTSEAALLILSSSVRSDVGSRLWTVQPGGQPYFSASLSRVEVAWNPVSKNLLFLGTPPVNAITVVNADSGAPLRALALAGELTGPAAVALQSVGIAEDGAIYACSLTSDGTQSPLRIYRWASDAIGVTPQIVFNGDPGAGAAERWGDSMAVRGVGAQTEILLTSRNGSRFAILAASGNSFVGKSYSVDLPPGSLGQGVSFGGAHSFWAKSYGSPLFEIEWQSGNPAAKVIRTVAGDAYRPSIAAIGFIPSRNWMVGQDSDEAEHVELHDFAPAGDGPTWIDTEFFRVPGKTGGPEGSVAVGTDRAFAASTEAGLIAISFGVVVQRPTLHVAATDNTLTFTWQGTFVLQVGSDPEGPWTDIPGAKSGHTIPVNPALNQFFRLRQ
ncbi:MAG: DUF4623 domain-containing protein [Verrucomicrobia bacterium]|nr:DUF4623 domain-containing protein [Verrucomicrobiota bacterium]